MNLYLRLHGELVVYWRTDRLIPGKEGEEAVLAPPPDVEQLVRISVTELPAPGATLQYVAPADADKGGGTIRPFARRPARIVRQRLIEEYSAKLNAADSVWPHRVTLRRMMLGEHGDVIREQAVALEVQRTGNNEMTVESIARRKSFEYDSMVINMEINRQRADHQLSLGLDVDLERALRLELGRPITTRRGV